MKVSPPSPLELHLNAAIQEERMVAVQWTLDPARFGNDLPFPRTLRIPLQLAVEKRNPDILRVVAGYFTGDALAEALALATERAWTEGALILKAANRAKPHPSDQFKPDAAFNFAILNDWERAIDALFPTRLDDDWQVVPLHNALERNKMAVAERLLPLTATKEVERAVHYVKTSEGLALLWPDLSLEARLQGLRTAIKTSNHSQLDWLASRIIPAFQEAATPQGIQSSLSTALGEAALNGLPQVIPSLLTLAPKGASLALQGAVASQNVEVIRLVLPVADPDVVRGIWERQDPPAWALVDRLAVYLPPEKQREWNQGNNPRLPRLHAAVRALDAQQHTPGRVRSPRRRS